MGNSALSITLHFLIFFSSFYFFSSSIFLLVWSVISKMRASNGSHWMLFIVAAAFILSVADSECQLDEVPTKRGSEEKLLVPVCGSDGVTYDHPNKLKYAACLAKEKNLAITQLYKGNCAQGECNDADREGCCRLGSPVCASNGISYFNMRVPEVKKCKTAFANPSLTLVDRGESCCFPGIPVCASNGITYGNENFFKTLDCVYAFMQGTLSISHRGKRCGADADDEVVEDEDEEREDAEDKDEEREDDEDEDQERQDDEEGDEEREDDEEGDDEEGDEERHDDEKSDEKREDDEPPQPKPQQQQQ